VPTAGYSGTPLPRKLGLRAGQRVAVRGPAPDGFLDEVDDVTWLRSLGRRDTYVFLWMIACVAGFPYWVIGHAAAIAAMYVALLSLQYTVFRNRRRA